MPKNLEVLRVLHGERADGANADAFTVVGEVEQPKKSVLDGQYVGKNADTSGYEKYAPESVAPDGNTTVALTALAQELLACERNLAAALAEAVRCREALEDVAERRLPDMMEAANMVTLGFEDRITGEKKTIVLVKDKWRVSLPPKSGPNPDPQWEMKHGCVHDWLESEEVGQSAVIKRDMEVPLGLIGDEGAAKIVAEFKELHPECEVGLKKYVEPAALTSIISKMLKAGKNINQYVNAKAVREARVKTK